MYKRIPPDDRSQQNSPARENVGSSDRKFETQVFTASPVEHGLTIGRVFSTDGQHPFDSVHWEKRDAAIKNHEGTAIFEQRDVEFPSTWSQLAINVVASKYFYGDLSRNGEDPANGGREHSLKQLIHRVTRTISDWGTDQGYFRTAADGQRFYDELTWLCVNQYGSFNSPVWFNVGLYHQYGVRDQGGKKIYAWDRYQKRVLEADPYERPQASACFIISVDDSIDDIWQLMGESARLFKYGSGVGADWSKLRSTHEKLSGGGTPSGPVSFMKVQDATGGTIKSGGKTRRAAIMQTLKVWHPDIMEFVVAKQDEEKKAWALIEEGYDGSFNGPAYGSVAFQNVNQSVRVTDEFMGAADGGKDYALRGVVYGEEIEKLNAADVLHKISEGTHVCGDPGLQYEDTIQRWHTCKSSGPINSSNPCSEYMFLDNSACNLASLNLRKFQRPDGTFDVERFRAASRLFITAMEILVDNAGYPSAGIAKNSHDYRPLGLGFANLGALLMSMGMPYDSDEGRAVAAALMAIEHCEAYARSAEIAANPRIGTFAGFDKNSESMLAVMRMHRDSVKDIHPSCPVYLHQAAQASADRMVELGVLHGYRNAQATVLAPTGTIGFMMDCDTTGVEPDIALVKYKLLAGKGDGMMKIVNRTVPEALERLGYKREEREAILAYIEKNDTIENAPHLKDIHLPVFDCAFKPFNGKRSIHHTGHIRMMAAVQPFISGAISKTVNMPETSTIEDIQDAYMQGWKLGLKAVAIYRENSKRSQPLSTTKGGNTAKEKATGDGMATPEPVLEPIVKEVEKIVYKPVRKRLPDERPSVTHKFSIAGHEGYLHIGLYPDTQMPGEIFITMAKQGSTIAGLMDAFATAISISLQYGVPLEDLCGKFSHMRFEPSGFTNNRQVPIAKSIMDYIFRYLSIKFLGVAREEKGLAAAVPSATGKTRTEVSVEGPRKQTGMSTDEMLIGGTVEAFLEVASQDETKPADRTAVQPDAHTGTVATATTRTATVTATSTVTEQSVAFKNQEDAPPCPNCGSITVRAGACYSCPNCGGTSGCG
ncbi:MAG: vitamin B12-dependent ribonucleotide reductase [Bacteroidetes bacterium]|nr:vitamin B12-dependent ribonucleotide reductase [Bacteroidota bacterium]